MEPGDEGGSGVGFSQTHQGSLLGESRIGGLRQLRIHTQTPRGGKYRPPVETFARVDRSQHASGFPVVAALA